MSRISDAHSNHDRHRAGAGAGVDSAHRSAGAAVGPVMHPLDPLSADEIRQAVAILRRDREVGPDWRFASVTLEEPPKAWLQAFSGGPFTRRARAVTWSRTDGTAYVALVDLTDERVEEFTPRPGVQPNFTRRGVARVRRDAARAPRGGRGARSPRHHRPSLVAGRHVGLWRRRDAGRSRATGASAGATSGCARARREPVRPPRSTGLHVVVDMNAMGCSRSRTTATTDRPPVMGEYVPDAGARPDPARRPAAAGDRAARGRVVHGRRQRAALAALAHAGRLQLPRGARAAPGRLRGRRPAATDRASAVASPRWSCRTAIRRPITTAAPRSTSASGASACMTQSLELGCDCLGEIRYLDAVLHDTARRAATTIRNAICIHEEDNAVLWKHVDHARRRRGAPDAAAGRLVPRHGRQLRVPRLLALLPGRQHRVRGARDRDHGRPPASASARRLAVRHHRRRAHVRAVPPALHRGAARPRHRRPAPTPSSRSTRRRSRSARTTRTALALRTARDAARDGGRRRRATTTGRRSGCWKVVNAGQLQRARRAGGLQAGADGLRPALMDRTARRCSSGPR